EQGQQRAEPLAPGVDEVAVRRRDERVLVVDDLLEAPLHRLQPGPQPGVQVRRGAGDEGAGRGAGGGSGHGHRRNCVALWASSRTGEGMMPSPSVTTRPATTANEVRADGRTTTVSPVRSPKYMRTMSLK